MTWLNLFFILTDHHGATLDAMSRARREFIRARDNGLEPDQRACQHWHKEFMGAQAASNVAAFYAKQFGNECRAES